MVIHSIHIYRYIPGYSLIILDIPSSTCTLTKTLWFSPIHKIHQKNVTPWFGEKKSPTNLRAPGWHYFPIQLASRPQMGGCLKHDTQGFQWKWLQLTGCFKTTVRDWDLEIGKTRHFETHSLYMWVFTGLQLSSTHNFLFETSIKIGVKSHFKTKKTSTLLHLPRFTFIPPKMSVRKKSSSKILENRLGRNRFALFIGSIHWTSMVNQQLQSFLLEAWRFHGLQLGLQQSTWFNGSVFPGLEQWKK